MKEKLKDKKVVYTIIGIISVLLVAIAVTYAYWLVTETQEGENVVTSACLDINLVGTNDITLPNQFPITDEEGKKLTPYEFTVTNKCNTAVDYQVALEALGEESASISAGALKVMLNEETPVLLSSKSVIDTTISGAYKSFKLTTGTLAASSEESTDDSATYKLRLWIDENASIEEMNKTFRSKIAVTIGQGIKATPKNPYEEGTLAYSIYDNAVTGDYYHSEVPDFTKANADGEFGLYNAEDNDGTSYYFRGDAEGNYLNIQYAGTVNTEKVVWILEGDTAEHNAWGIYDTEESCQSMLTSYEEQGAPIPGDSCIQATITEEVDGIVTDSWRIVRINGDNSIRLIYAGDVSNRGTCQSGGCITGDLNDLNTGFYVDNIEPIYDILSDSKYCYDQSMNAYRRLGSTPSPTFTCDSNYEYSGIELSGKVNTLTGFLSADEAFFAGANNNSNHYLNFGARYWLGTAYSDTNPETTEPGKQYFIPDNGILTYTGSYGNFDYRLVINIKPDVTFTGSGSSLDPYVIIKN